MAAGAHNRSILYGPGADDMLRQMTLTSRQYAMGPVNTGWCARVTARDARDIKGVKIEWASVATPGTVELRIETIDATTRKPTGTLYDAAASKSFTPTVGAQTVLFDVLPTAGLTAAAEYGVVLLTTVAGTTQHLWSYGDTVGVYPTVLLTAADGTTRSNFAEISFSCPRITFILEDDTEEQLECCPYVSSTGSPFYSTLASALKFTVPTGAILQADYCYAIFQRIGTPAGDTRVRIFDSADNVVAGTTVIANKDSLLNSTFRGFRKRFAAPVELVAGTYRLVFDSALSDNSSNCFSLRGQTIRSAAAVGDGFSLSTTTDLTATPIVWTDSATTHPAAALGLDTLSGAGGGSGGGGFIIGG